MKYLFIDEVQNVNNFEEVINGFRTKGDYSIFITGSNSYLLRGELVTKLTGRYLEFELFTLSFYEYVQMKKFYEKPVNTNLIIDNKINYGPNLENIVYVYAKSLDYSVSVGRIGKLECDFILSNMNNDYSYVQVSYTIALNKETEDREYRSLEQIKDNYPKYVMTTDFLLQKRSGIKHVNLMEFITDLQKF